MLTKPKFGERCNGCGLCCTLQPCAIAVAVFGEHPGPCVALEHEDGRTFCGVLRKAPYEIQPAIAFTLAIGAGCDSSDEVTA